VEEDEEDVDEENREEGVMAGEVSPHISLDVLEGIVGFHTMKVIGKVEKEFLYILVDSGSTHKFLNIVVALKLKCKLTTIKLFTVQATNEEKMICKSVCKGLKWKMQGVCFEADAFIIELRDCDTVLCNYKHLWMSFD
jgi:hypothetical protein